MKNIKLRILTILSGILVISCIDDQLEEAPSKFLDYDTKANLELPFSGEWYVFHGGRSLGENSHASIREQRFALDIIQRVNNRSFSGDGKKNEDYYCFGKPLFAPAAGKIVAMKNTVIDNIPGQLDLSELPGNYVVIDHKNGEYSFLAHIKQGTVTVNIGDEVVKGQELGLTGNSGNSTEPHLHYHMQNTTDIYNGEGLPSQFQNYYANGVFVERGEPIRNQLIRKN